MFPAFVLSAEPEWQSLLPVIDLKQDVVVGDWKKTDRELTVAAAAGARISLPVAPQGEYDFRVSFTRNTGAHSVALIFVHGGKQASFEIDAWGSHLGGIQNIGGQDLRRNATRKQQQQLTNRKKSTMLVEVRRDQIRALLDGELIATHKTTGSDLSLVDVWRMPKTKQLGIGVWQSAATIHSIEIRSHGEEPFALARTAPSRPVAANTPRPTTPTSPTTPPSTRPTTNPSTPTTKSTGSARGKRVLMIIANQDFFYREYADPRAELERAGVRVTVAAGRKAPCRPHANSGQGRASGVVQPDLAVADVLSDDYDAVLFSGGWGASAYQFAFPGSYSTRAYNGNRNTKAQINRIINDFTKQDKYVCALCNGVSILAWARVDGKSPLRGKRVCSPVRQAAAGIYNGRRAQPSCRWHPEANGAILSPPGAVGNPRTNRDDVIVDGKIITGEDDPSAREMGRRLAEVLRQ